jgi:glycosyltransferase involved in cell wall biosynthesis
MLNATFFPSDMTACSWQRAFFPGYWMNKLRLANVNFSYGANPEDVEHSGLIVYQRHYDPGDPLTWWNELGRMGKKRVYELDDDIFCMPHDNPFRRYFDGPVKTAMKQMLREADLVLCSTNGLATSMQRFNQNLAVCPNGVDPEVFDLPVTRDPEKTRIFFIGSRTHDHDFALALLALKTILKAHRDVEMVFVGDPPTHAAQELSFPAQVYFTKWIPYEELYVRLAEMGPDIVIAPLTDHPFNQRKSAIKWLESSAFGAMTIASPVSDFKKFCVNHETALLPTTPKEWEEALTWMVTDRDARQAIAARAKATVKARFSYDVLASRWAKVLSEVLQ